MKTVAYLRVSSNTQDTNNQRLAILEFARTERMAVDEFIEIHHSSRRSTKARTYANFEDDPSQRL